MPRRDSTPILTKLNSRFRTRLNGYYMMSALIRFSRLAMAAAAVLLGLVRDLFALSQNAGEANDRQLHDADLVGEYNHRTGRLDAGNDPYGWYDED